MPGGSLNAWVMRSACCAWWRKPCVSLPADTDPARNPRAHWRTTMHDIPLTLRDALFACAFGLALGALVALGL
jgi:hypothetical protein